eukprot:TRINITY_DN43420_c0_g1_i1.p1 TRINITY_DN43420_c0_g1~~TRINITY_DN43420_c0_g1_i1.p1  ORF type:complete len:444 (-),score=116.07 TRINITY_DN43420_c0_g1_i1:27-1289(-)
MQFLRRIGDILENEEGTASSHADGHTGPGRPAGEAAGSGTSGAKVHSVAGQPELQEDEALQEANVAAKLMQQAASAAESLSTKLPAALRRAQSAEQEVVRLQKALAEAQERIESIQAAQLRLAEGFLGEIRQRDAELAVLRAAASMAPATDVAAGYASEASLPSEGAGSTAEAGENPVLVTLPAEGQLCLEFDRNNLAMKIVASEHAECLTRGKLFVGDEVLSVNGLSARNMSWQEFDEALDARPVVVSVHRSKASESSQGGTPAAGLAGRVRSLAGWTRQAAKAMSREFEAAMAEIEDDGVASNLAANLVSSSQRKEVLPAETELDLGEAQTADAEVRNRPFYELVRSSMTEAMSGSLEAESASSSNDAAFERWLRQFHSERDDEWYANNHSRVFNAFRPHWDEVRASLQKAQGPTFSG